MIEEFNVDLKAEWSYLAPHVARKNMKKKKLKQRNKCTALYQLCCCL